MCFSSAERADDRNVKVANRMARVFFAKIWFVVKGTALTPYPVRRRLRQSACQQIGGHVPQGLKPTFFQAPKGTAEQAAERCNLLRKNDHRG